MHTSYARRVEIRHLKPRVVEGLAGELEPSWLRLTLLRVSRPLQVTRLNAVVRIDGRVALFFLEEEIELRRTNVM